MLHFRPELNLKEKVVVFRMTAAFESIDEMEAAVAGDLWAMDVVILIHKLV